MQAGVWLLQYIGSLGKWQKQKRNWNQGMFVFDDHINLFQTFLCPLKAKENFSFSDIVRDYRNSALA